MTLIEAIASGKRYRHSSKLWSHGGLLMCDLCSIGEGPIHTDPLNNYIYVCSGYQVLTVDVPEGNVCIAKDSYASGDWILEPSEEDYKQQAESILSNLGLKLEGALNEN